MSTKQLLSLSDGRVLEYALSTTPQDGPIVLLSNSLCSPFDSWDRVAQVLHAKGFRTLRYNQPGHGNSTSPSNCQTTFADLAADVAALLRHLDVPKVKAWIGISLGAATGIVYVTSYPDTVEKLVLCDTISCSPANAGIDDAFGPRVAAAREDGNMEAVVKGTMGRWFGQQWIDANPEEAERMRSLMATTTIDGFATCISAIQSKTFDLRPLFTQVGSAVQDALLVVGENDANLPQSMTEMRDGIQQGFKDAGKSNVIELKVLKNAGHVSYIDGFEQFCDVITHHLEN